MSLTAVINELLWEIKKILNLKEIGDEPILFLFFIGVYR